MLNLKFYDKGCIENAATNTLFAGLGGKDKTHPQTLCYRQEQQQNGKERSSEEITSNSLKPHYLPKEQLGHQNGRSHQQT